MTGHQLEQAAHSPIGASSCERWWNCPGSVKLMENLPPFPGTVYTATGTVAHTVGETTLLALQEVHRTGTPVTEVPEDAIEDEIGRSYVEDGHEIEVDEAMAEAVKVYIDTVVGYVQEYGVDLAQDLRTEVKFDLTHIDPEAFGTCDAVIVVPMNRIIVIDYKHGQGHAVEVENNHQLQYYALGAYYGLPESDRDDLGYVEMVIVQPRARHLDGPVRRFTYRVGDLLTFEAELAAAVARVRSGDSDLLVGTWCKFCNAKPVCPATRRAIQESAQLAFDRIDQERIVLPPPAELSPERLSHLIKNAELIQSWVKSVFALGTQIADNGTEIPGYKMVTKYGRRRWINEKDVEEAFGLDFGEKMYNRKIKSPAQMEKVLGKKRADELAPYIETPVSGKTLVSEDDAREGVETGAAAAFAEGWA